MAGGSAILKVDIIADATKAIAALKDTGAAGETAGGQFSGVRKAIGGALAVGAVVAFGKSSVSAAEESAVATARLGAIFKSMGDETGNAAKEAENYAGALSKKIAVDDEAIMAAQAQLATFGAVSDETARGAGIFDRATAAAADLAAAGFGTLDGNAVQLGKALQDPTKGLAALGKSGVTFTDAQKEQIKAMQESGDLLGAQKIVLGAVESQVKGTAAATATGSEKMSIAFGEVQEQVGGFLLPIMTKLVDVFLKYQNLILPVGAALLGIVVAVKAYEMGAKAVKVAQLAWNAVQAAFNFIMAANPILLVVIAIVALVAAVILAYNKVGWFRDFVDAAFAGVVAAFGWIRDAAAAVFGWVADNWPLLLAILTGPVGIAVGLIVGHWDTIRDAIAGVLNWIRSNWATLLAILTGPIGAAVLLITKNWDTIKDAATALYDWVRGKFQALADFIAGLVSGIASTARGIADAVKGPINAVLKAWNALEFKVPEVDVGPIHFGGQTLGLPNIPLLASGGLVTRTGIALVHRGEAFSGVGARGWGSTNVTVNVTTTGLGADAPQIQRAVASALRGYTARNGPLDVPIRTAG